MPRAWVLIDGDCGLCKRFGAWVRRHDTAGRFCVTPYQEAPNPPVDDALRKRCETALHVIDEEGVVRRGGDAFVYLRRAFGKPLAGVLAVQPVKALVDVFYLLVSRNREFFARFLYTKETWTG